MLAGRGLVRLISNSTPTISNFFPSPHRRGIWGEVKLPTPSPATYVRWSHPFLSGMPDREGKLKPEFFPFNSPSLFKRGGLGVSFIV